MKSSTKKPFVLVICGPTGIGKTSAAVEAAEHFNGEIISADSMQLYRFMDIGTAKPTAAEQARVPHHLVDLLAPNEDFDAALFSDAARKIAFSLCEKGKLPVVAGGTGLYIKAMLRGLFRAPSPDPAARRRLKAEVAAAGTEVLHQRLAAVDPSAAVRIHPKDSFRIIRALETAAATGKSITSLQRRHAFNDSPFRVFKIGLSVEREVLYERIDRRVDTMIAAGLVGEVLGLLDAGYGEDLKTMQSLGYRHMAGFLAGRLSWHEALRTMKRDTRRYAKRQLTWFRADPEIVWTDPERIQDLYPQVATFLKVKQTGP